MKAKFLALFLALPFLLASCDQWIDPSINVDPTSPQDVSFSVILPTTQAGYAYILGGDIARYASLFTQHHTGIARQHTGLYEYNIKEDDINNAWTNSYAGFMKDYTVIISKADETNSPHYKGVAQIMMAQSLGMWTDILGAIPYSEAFQGTENSTPKYDSQEAIYTAIQQLLTDGATNVGAAASVFKPGVDDFIFGGDMAKWAKAAHTLKARYYLHIKNYNGALTALTNGLAENGDNMMFFFRSKETEANPHYQFNVQRGDISMGGKVMEFINNWNDPRAPMFAEPDDDGSYTQASAPGPYYSSINSPVPFITYAEAKFIEAECHFRLGAQNPAYTAYIAAVRASLEMFGVAADDIDTYVAQAAVDPGEANLTLQNIMEQKYIHMYMQPESWTDWRRTGFPALTPTKGDQIPRRWFYPQSERLFNNASLSAMAASDGINITAPTFIFTKMWWDAMW